MGRLTTILIILIFLAVSVTAVGQTLRGVIEEGPVISICMDGCDRFVLNPDPGYQKSNLISFVYNLNNYLGLHVEVSGSPYWCVECGALNVQNITILPAGEQVVAWVGCGDFMEGTQVIVPIDIDMSSVNPPNEKLGSYTATLNWNPTLMSYVSYSGGTTSGWGSPTVNEDNVSTGYLGFANANASGTAGTINIINVTFDVIGSIGQNGVIDLEFSAMTSAITFFNLMPLLSIQDCLYTITPAGILGDVNDDTFVNSTDALIVLSCDVGINVSQFCPMNCGDVNSDGMINSTDALIILSYDVGISVPFPVGQPGCPSNVTPCPGCNP